MGIETNNNFNFGDLVKGWAGACTRFNNILPFLGPTLWQVGPLPWMMNGNFATSIWSNMNGSMPWGDIFQSSEKKSGSSDTKKFNELEKVLKDYAATLTGTEKATLDEKLKGFEDLKASEKTKEKYEELLEIYDDYRVKIKESKLNDAGIGKKDLEPLADMTFENLKPKIDNNDVVDIIDAWNTNESTKGTKLITSLQEKIKNSVELENADYKNTLDKLHEKMKNKAESLEDDSNLSSKSNKALKDAIDTFVEFEGSSRYTSAEYVKAFDNLYMATRLAEAEIAQKELKDEFKFLGEDSLFADADFVSEVQRDLRSEGLRKAQTVEIPEDDETGTTAGATGTTAGATGTTAGATGTTTTTTATSQTLASDQDSYGLSVGDNLYNQLAGVSFDFKTKKDLDNINKENIVGVIEGFNTQVKNGKEKYRNDGIIEWLKDDGISIDNCNKILKAVMEKALSAGINAENSDAYKQLQEFFDAKLDETGKLIFNKNTQKHIAQNTPRVYSPYGTAPTTAIKTVYTKDESEKLDSLINKLIEEIKAKEAA